MALHGMEEAAGVRYYTTGRRCRECTKRQPRTRTIRIVHAESGFDFLGFNVRRYHGKLLIKPSTTAQRRIRERLGTEMPALRGANAAAVLKKINPIVGNLRPSITNRSAMRAMPGMT
ncbi:hypothetical protein [Embleya sp. NBC_00896]|uniref:hypothetical protein n=1 Tax=Embleya sp. NBC_00896 TaxID=2975961 RepID=UPI00386B1C21